MTQLAALLFASAATAPAKLADTTLIRTLTCNQIATIYILSLDIY